jgi:Tol biopolymer transport system component
MALTPGTKIGPYEIQSALGAGGMGEVYRARDGRLGRDVALKILPESFASDGERLRRFEQESQAVAALNHPNILAIYDVGEHNRAPFLVSELLDGESLRAVLDRGALPQRKAVEYGVQIAQGLSAAHQKGIVHRDLKPENLFVCRDGRVKVLDFGLAKLAAKASEGPDSVTLTSSHTAAGTVMGTTGYMAPEQVRGQAVDARTDMFAFGAVLFEMLSGRRAFHRETAAETMTAILKDDLPEVADLPAPIVPALDRIVRRCLEKSPEQRFQSAKDLAFALEALTQISGHSKSGAQAAVEVRPAESRRKLAGVAGVIALAAAMLGLGWWLGLGGRAATLPEYLPVTFRAGYVDDARFTPDGSIVYSASWERGEKQLYLSHNDDTGSRELGLKESRLLSVSKRGELAILLRSVGHGGWAHSGTLARVALNGGTPRETLDNVEDADWAADSEGMAVVRFAPESSHWRLEYPVGRKLIESINWISNPKISPDGKWVAFADHENTGGDDEGSVAVVGPDGQEKKLSSGWASIEGMGWSPAGNEIWFAASASGSADQLRGVTLAGRLRTIATAPGGIWLEDLHDGVALTIAQHMRLNISAMPPDGKEEHELGWLGWSALREISRDGRKVLFEEEAEGGGPNDTVFLRDTDGSPPVQIGAGVGRAIAPGGKWVITQPAKGGPLSVVPTGAGEARQLTHDNISYGYVVYLPDGKQLLAQGIEPGHSGRDYLIDVNNGNAVPVTPEGVIGDSLSQDGRRIAVAEPDGKWGIWSLDGGSLRLIPGLDSTYSVIGWAPDGEWVYAVTHVERQKTAKVYRVNITTGKMDFWKEFGANLPTGATSVSPPYFSPDGKAYAYGYTQALSDVYTVKGLK